MGYYSNVAYVIEFKDKEQKETFINLQKVKDNDFINDALMELLDDGDKMLGFHEDSVKWYDDFDDVKAHHELMESAAELFEEASYLFIRLGEQSDDVEENAGGDDGWSLYDYVTPVRYVQFSFKGSPVIQREESKDGNERETEVSVVGS